MEGELGIGGENPVDERKIEELEEKVRDYDELKRKVEEYERSLQEYERMIADLQNKIEELSNEVRELREEKERYATALKAYERAVQEPSIETSESTEAETSREQPTEEQPAVSELLREYESRLQSLEKVCKRTREDLAVLMGYRSRVPASTNTKTETNSKKTAKGKKARKRSAKKNNRTNNSPVYHGVPDSELPLFGYTEEVKGADISAYEASIVNNMRAWLATNYAMDIDNPLIALEVWYARHGYTPDEARRIVTLRAAEVYLKRNREQLEKEMKKIFK